MSEIILEVKNLTKSFGSLQAVKGVSFQLEKGMCFGLLGPNGAGKSTTIEMIEGLTKPDNGDILYKGKPVDKHFKKVAGIQFQSTALQDFLSVEDNLKLFSSFYDAPLPLAYLIEVCDLEGFLDQEADKLSGGQRQRLLLALALINDPDVIFLDEPTTGLDPKARRQFWQLIESIKAQNKTLILTTHYMEEAYLLSDEIAIMSQGKIIAQGSPDDLLQANFEDRIIELPNEALENVLKMTPPPIQCLKGEKTSQIYSQNLNESIATLLALEVDLQQLKIRERTLDDLFLKLTEANHV